MYKPNWSIISVLDDLSAFLMSTVYALANSFLCTYLFISCSAVLIFFMTAKPPSHFVKVKTYANKAMLLLSDIYYIYYILPIL